MKKYSKRFKDIFTQPWIPVGPFFISLGFMAVATYIAIQLGQFSQGSKIAIVSAEHHAIGENIVAGNSALKVESVRYDTTGNQVLKPEAGNEYLMPTVDITNHSNENLQLIPLLFFYIKDSQGNVYDITAAPIHNDQLTGPILPGETAREEIGFEVPTGIDHPALYFEPGTTGDPVVAVDLSSQ
jgi:hypothetical protein